MDAHTMHAIPVHAGWADGRTGFIWCRLDAVIDPARLLRAELTWDEDEATRRFHTPVLVLEANRRESPGDTESYKTWDTVAVPLADDVAVELMTGDPLAILARYPDQIAQLDFWDPSKGYTLRDWLYDPPATA